MQRIELQDGCAFLMASAEKALADTLRCRHGLQLKTQKDLHQFIIGDLRIDETELRRLHIPSLKKLAQAYRSRKIRLLAGVVQRLSKRKKD